MAIREGASLSGQERNHLFLSERGEAFTDVSGVSGLDHPADGRSLAVLDFDRDGWSDFVVTNANNPRTLLYRNRIGDRVASEGAPAARSFALRLSGGNRTAEPSDEWSHRDGYGAAIEVDVAGTTLVRELRAGDGRGAQNSATLLIGIGAAMTADELRIRWPSGRLQTVGGVPAGTLLTVYENPQDGPDGVAHLEEPYVRPSVFDAQRPTGNPLAETLRLAADRATGEAPRLVLYTTMATWCLPCLHELPALETLRGLFDETELAMVGVPYDASDSAESLDAWAGEHQPAYSLASRMPREDVEAIKAVLLERLRIDALPSSLITDGAGTVLLTRFGPPTVSDIHRLLAKTSR